MLAQRGYTPVQCTQSPGGISKDEYVESLLDHGVAGIIFVSGRHADTTADHHQRYRNLLERHLPVVFINGYAPDLAGPFVSDYDQEAMELSVSHLVQLGHRRIGLAVGRERFVPVQRKRAGFVAVTGRLLGLSEHESLG